VGVSAQKYASPSNEAAGNWVSVCGVFVYGQLMVFGPAFWYFDLSAVGFN